MKKMILFSSLLMISALLYGAIDYLISDRSGNLNALYKSGIDSKKVDKKISKGGRVSYANSNSFQAKKKVSIDRTLNLEKFSRAALVDMPIPDSLEAVVDTPNVVLTAMEKVSVAKVQAK